MLCYNGFAYHTHVLVGEKRKLDDSDEPPSKRQASAEPEAMDTDVGDRPFPLPVRADTDQKRSSMISKEEQTVVVNCLIGIATCLTEFMQKKGTCARVMTFINESLKIWPGVDINLEAFDKQPKQDAPAEIQLGQMSNAIEVMVNIVQGKPSDWLVSNIGVIHKNVEKWVKAESPKLSKDLPALISGLYKAIEEVQGDDPSDASAAFTRLIESKIAVSLKDITTAVGPTAINTSPTHIVCFLYLIQGFPVKTEQQYLPELVKMFGKLVKDHQDQSPGMPVQATDSLPRLLIMLLESLRARVLHMGEHRRSFLTSLVQVMDFSTDLELLRAILAMIRHWVLGHESLPTPKEKANSIVKFMTCAEKDQGLLEEYLDLVATIYSDPSFACSELTVRLEQAFLLGSRNESPAIRRKFSDIFHRSIGKSVYIRLNYILGVQNWEHLASHFWLRQALDLLLGSVVPSNALYTSAPTYKTNGIAVLGAVDSITKEIDKTFMQFVDDEQQFLRHLQSIRMEILVDALRHLLYFNDSVPHVLWINLFPICWGSLGPRERHDVHKSLIPLLAKDYHIKQADMRPNVIQALLEGICRCDQSVQPRLPPQLLRYLGKTYDAWFTSVELLQQSISDTRFAGVIPAKEDEKIRESTMDALCELFWNLSDEDYFHGLWRRRSLFAETNAAVSYEQGGMWVEAQRFYEAAQAKARGGLLPFTESEYRLWEEHWVLSAEKLQQWDILTDLAKQEQNAELFLECAWRISDSWISERESLQVAIETMQENNPRRKVFQAFMILLKFQESPQQQSEFHRMCDEGVQSTLRRWFSLPEQAISAHVGLLHTFQQFVELHEGAQIQQILAATNASNISDKIQEMKGVLTTWKDRLPNMWDDITLWSDLVAWRQHVFQIVNKAYLPLIPQLNHVQHNGGNMRDNPSSHAFRGYHETAWTINRFAHIARKHQLIDVCNDSLSKIYTLPNIEIHEAFFKLREQAKSYFVNSNDYATGLDVINNTNLVYFSPQQKAEFFALKGIFFAKLNLYDDAEKAFSSSIQLDTNLAKGWAAYAQYHDRMFKERPHEMKYGAGAMSSYLHAAGIYQNGRTRKFLARILWLLSLDSDGSIAEAFDDYKGDIPVWYWITFIPQLLAALSNKEAPQAKEILKKIAKQYPQV